MVVGGVMNAKIDTQHYDLKQPEVCFPTDLEYGAHSKSVPRSLHLVLPQYL